MAQSTTTTAPHPSWVPVFTHLLTLTDSRGVYAGVAGREPRAGLGYSTADAASALVVVLREPSRTPPLLAAANTYLAFLERAVGTNGSTHARQSASGAWTDGAMADLSWGRAIEALGCAIRFGATQAFRDRATRVFLRSCNSRSQDLRAASLAAIGAAPLTVRPGPAAAPARALVADCLSLVPRRTRPDWGWPEPRLGVANATLCDALVAGGSALGRPQTVRQGLAMLAALLRLETSRRGHLSPTGTAGRGPGESRPLWDQRPIEAVSLATACAHAATLTGENRWREGLARAWAWFTGHNDRQVALYDQASGATSAALRSAGPDPDCTAEAATAALRTLQQARRLQVAGR